jgi:hypothetical protein
MIFIMAHDQIYVRPLIYHFALIDTKALGWKISRMLMQVRIWALCVATFGQICRDWYATSRFNYILFWSSLARRH